MKKIFAANWKLYKTPKEARDFFVNLLPRVGETSGELVFFPSTICLESTSNSLKGSKVQWGAQNCYSKLQGAFTGETSAQVVKELGGSYVLIGHSERRSLFGESDALIADKVEAAQSVNLIPMLCIGETLDEREAGTTTSVLQRQLQQNLAKAHKNGALVVAYEPVWAIGTGKVASPEQVAETHKAIANILEEMGFKNTNILYGGSVKPENAASLISLQHVGGFLIGGASLEVESFIRIAKN